ncbi:MULTISPECIES: FecR family protein [unclassified Acidovorax]|uniref:FecR family protein n=1 Tax=unclassified Acidovorax TaxID=2684926 RepID=UPI003ECD4BB3
MPRSDAADLHRPPSQGLVSGLSTPDASDPIAAQAVTWAVQLRSGDASAADRMAFDHWRHADPRHEAAAAHLERALGTIGNLPAGLVPRQAMRKSLLAKPARRQALRNTLGLVIAGAGGGLLWSHGRRPLSALGTDFSTGTAERRVYALQDGSRLWLNARSVVDHVFDGTSRHLHLRTGELIVEVARDPLGRPFVVHTEQGHAQALGTRFLVRQDAESSLVAVLHSSVHVSSLAGMSLTLHEGESARLTAHGVQPEKLSPSAAAAWEDGFIEVHDRPLQEVVDSLRPYHPGMLRVSPQAARLRVTGSFPLEDVNRTLDALVQALPITIQRRMGWWVTIDVT